MPEPATWTSGTEKLVRKLRTSSIVGMGYAFNSEGCAALAGLIEEMARKLDLAVERKLLRDDG